MNKTNLAKEMGVSRGSLYYQSKLEPKDEQLKAAILATLDEHPAYGHKRIALHLDVNKKRVLRVMKKYGIEPIIKRKKAKSGRKSVETYSYQNWTDKLCPLAPDIMWASDFTYIFFQQRWWYLATIIDVYTREIVGTAFSCYHNQDLVLEALHNALTRRATPHYLHSDQGGEYMGHAYTSFVDSLNITISTSPQGKPWKMAIRNLFTATLS